jgi:pyruvate dehydrogenase E1 component alpha subunit
MTKVAEFAIEYTQFLDPSGRATARLPEFATDPAALIPLYRAMVLTRRFDAKAVALQRTGRLGTLASSLGQEAVVVGLASAMLPEDVLLPSYRETGAQLYRGVSLDELLLYWGGDERGSDFAGPRHDFPVSVPVASQCLHAAGVGYAMKLLREPRVAVCVCGDGATSNGAFYEAINCAGAWRVNAVFVVNNNQWAISVPRTVQTAAETLAQKAIAAGIPGCQVDGNDVIAVRHGVGEALARARAGDGPSVVEALTYRMSDHTTADDATRYRNPEAVSERWAADPIPRLRTFLVAAGAWSKADEERLVEEINGEIDAAVERYLKAQPQPPEAMFDYLYAELPRALAEQRAATAAVRGDDHA